MHFCRFSLPSLCSLLLALSGLAAHGQTVCVQPPSGILAWWPLDENAGSTSAELIDGEVGTRAITSAPIYCP